jgi:hypothetical protein
MLDDVAHLMMFSYAKIRIAHLMPDYAKKNQTCSVDDIAHLMPGYAKN